MRTTVGRMEWSRNAVVLLYNYGWSIVVVQERGEFTCKGLEFRIVAKRESQE